jgi:putative membrane protein insertion efficiency factor
MNAARKLVLFSLRLYKLLLSPVLHFFGGPMAGCRFEPTCSEYAAEAVVLHGVWQGTFLAVRRICRCGPWGGCGHDPVPENFRFRLPSFTLKRAATPVCCGHVETQHAAHFGCPPPAR